MHRFKLWTVLLFMAIMVLSCTEVESLDMEKEAVENMSKRDKEKWAEEDKRKQENLEDSIRISEENKRLYELYLEDLREYKKTKHPIMFGWFNSWSAITPGDYSQLNLIPDSMDIVSIWGNCFDLDEQRKQQLKEVQSKGTKVVIGWIVENVGNQIKNVNKADWPSIPEEGVKAYAKAIVDSINKYGYDGFDIDYEPSYASPFKPGNHCGDWGGDWTVNKPVVSCNRDSNKELENLFFKTLRELLGEDKILNINGSIHWLDPASAKYFNYFVVQSYGGAYSSWTDQVVNRLGAVKDQIVYTESFENKQANRENFMRYADFVVNTLKGEAGGIGAYHINEDAFDKNNYRYVRDAIRRMNPPIN